MIKKSFWQPLSKTPLTFLCFVYRIEKLMRKHYNWQDIGDNINHSGSITI